MLSRRTVLALVAFVTLNASAGFAVPISHLGQGQTALRIGSDTFYPEHKLADNFTLGFSMLPGTEAATWMTSTDSSSLPNNLQGIVGSRDCDYSGSKMFLEMTVNGPMATSWDGRQRIQRLQVDADVGLAHNVDLNLNDHSFMPDVGNSRNGVGIGATLKF